MFHEHWHLLAVFCIPAKMNTDIYWLYSVFLPKWTLTFTGGILCSCQNEHWHLLAVFCIPAKMNTDIYWLYSVFLPKWTLLAVFCIPAKMNTDIYWLYSCQNKHWHLLAVFLPKIVVTNSCMIFIILVETINWTLIWQACFLSMNNTFLWVLCLQ